MHASAAPSYRGPAEEGPGPPLCPALPGLPTPKLKAELPATFPQPEVMPSKPSTGLSPLALHRGARLVGQKATLLLAVPCWEQVWFQGISGFPAVILSSFTADRGAEVAVADDEHTVLAGR